MNFCYFIEIIINLRAPRFFLAYVESYEEEVAGEGEGKII